jgi:hypothetical protein
MSALAPQFPTAAWDGSTGNNWRADRNWDIDPDSEDWDRISSEVIAVEDGLLNSRAGNGTKNGTGVTTAEGPTYGILHRTVLTLADVTIAMTDHGAAGCHGSLKVYDFPAGLIQILGCVQNLTTKAGVGGIADGAALIGSMGSDAAGVDNATLTVAEANVVPSTAGTLIAGAGTLKGKTTAALMAAGVFDGTSTALDLYLNLAVPDADSSADDTLTINGTITLTWATFISGQRSIARPARRNISSGR